MKLMQAWIIALLALNVSAVAEQSYHGTFTETIVGNAYAPRYEPGNTYYGQYWYHSSTIDGTFTTPDPLTGDGNATFDGLVFAPFVPRGEQYYSGEWMTLRGGPYGGTLVVTNGEVTSFKWTYEKGGNYIDADGPNGTLIAYSYYDNPIYNPETGGFYPTPEVTCTLTFDPPQVPDAVPTAWLLLLGSAALLGCRCVSARRGQADIYAYSDVTRMGFR